MLFQDRVWFLFLILGGNYFTCLPGLNHSVDYMEFNAIS